MELPVASARTGPIADSPRRSTFVTAITSARLKPVDVSLKREKFYRRSLGVADSCRRAGDHRD